MHWKVSYHRYIAQLICVRNARKVAKSVKIDQSEGAPDPSIPERLFVKFANRPLRFPPIFRAAVR